jgi:hypothetical protein
MNMGVGHHFGFMLTPDAIFIRYIPASSFACRDSSSMASNVLFFCQAKEMRDRFRKCMVIAPPKKLSTHLARQSRGIIRKWGHDLAGPVEQSRGEELEEAEATSPIHSLHRKERQHGCLRNRPSRGRNLLRNEHRMRSPRTRRLRLLTRALRRPPENWPNLSLLALCPTAPTQSPGYLR